jgi:O-6-methylguanine DNA methyltransferase
MPLKSFRERVFEIVSRIPSGKTYTYGEVAHKAGNKKAARAVGALLKTNYDPRIPCHRVIKKDGSLGGYNRGVERNKCLLEEEALLVTRSK